MIHDNAAEPVWSVTGTRKKEQDPSG